MNLGLIIVYIMLFFMVLGITDKLFLGNRFGYGTQFEAGILSMGPLALAMIGIMCFAPVLGNLIRPLVTPIYDRIGSDPAMIAGSILASDMGGYPLATAMTCDVQIQHLSGIYVGSMMGATIVFMIPVSLGIIDDRDRPLLAKGILAGLIAAPIGSMISALVEGIPYKYAFVNLAPSVGLAVLLAVGLSLKPDMMLKGFEILAKFIAVLIHICLGAAVIEALTGIIIIPGMNPIGPQIENVGMIAMTLSGAFPMVHFITTAFSKPLGKLGRMIGINETAAAGMVACLANNIPMFSMLKDMDEDGKVLSVAFAVCASFALGDHLGYASVQDQLVVFPMIAGKVAGGMIGVMIARLLVLRRRK